MPLRNLLPLLMATAALAGIGGKLAAEDAPHQTAAVAPDSNPSDPQQIAKGKALYALHCSHCHGFNMVYAGSAAFDLRTFPHDDKPRFVNSVTHGKNNRMPPWGDVLKPEEIDQLWAYILTGGKG